MCYVILLVGHSHTRSYTKREKKTFLKKPFYFVWIKNSVFVPHIYLGISQPDNNNISYFFYKKNSQRVTEN
jgi:hypothetical protein